MRARLSPIQAFAGFFLFLFAAGSLSYGLYLAGRTDLWTGVKTGLLFGLLGASSGTALVVLFYLCLKLIIPVAVQVHQQRTLVVQGTLSEVFAWWVEYLNTARFIKQVATFPDRATVEAKTRRSFLTPSGENITVTCRSLGGEFSRILIESEPSLRTAIMDDRRKNLRNVQMLEEALRRRFPVREATDGGHVGGAE